MAKATYVLLINLTDKGKVNFKKSYTENRDRFKKAVEGAGGKLTGFVTAGPTDAVEILEMPDEDSALKILLGRLNVEEIKVTTLKAWPEDQVRKAL